MDENIYNLALKLNNLIKENPSFVRLNELEKELENNDEIIKLAYVKDIACIKYGDILKYCDENSLEAVEARKELASAKTNLDNHPVVIEYNKTYSDVKKILFEVNNILFEDFKNKGCC